MTRKNLCWYTIVCFLFMNVAACSSDDDYKEKSLEMPKTIKDDFDQRQPSSEIINFKSSRSDTIFEIKFIDINKNKGETFYADQKWKITIKEINEFSKLPKTVQNSFKKSEYADSNILDIVEISRDDIERSLYRLHFKHLAHNTPDVEHYTFMNDDGLILTTLNYKTNDDWMFPVLPKAHFDYIKNKYAGAEVRGYVNNSGYYEYFIIHNNIIKFVFFNGKVPTDRSFWKETSYELPIDSKIPENVMNVLNRIRIDDDFNYTNIYKIETSEGNAYSFMDSTHGYTIGEDVPLQ